MGVGGIEQDVLKGIRAVIFDLDGTIFDSINAHLEELEEIWRRLKLTRIDREQVKEIMAQGQPFWDSLGALLPSMTPSEIEDVKKRGIEMDKEFWKDQNFIRKFNRLIPKADDVLRTLKRKGISLGLVTSIKRAWGDQAIYYTFREVQIEPEEFFEVIIMREDAPRMKPFPDPVLECVRRLKKAPYQCLYVGDSPSDILSGKGAGVKTAGVLTGVGTLESLSKEKPDLILQSIDSFIHG